MRKNVISTQPERDRIKPNFVHSNTKNPDSNQYCPFKQHLHITEQLQGIPHILSKVPSPSKPRHLSRPLLRDTRAEPRHGTNAGAQGRRAERPGEHGYRLCSVFR